MSVPPSPATEKYRWWLFKAVTITSRGSARNAGSYAPVIATGDSSRFATIPTSSSSSTSEPPSAAAHRRASARTRARRAAGSRMTPYPFIIEK